MKRVLIFLIFVTTLVSCDQVNTASLRNKSSRPISTSLYFFNYDPADTDGRQNSFIKYLMEDSVIKDNAKLTLLRNKIARVEFVLQDNSSIELIYDTAPLREGTVDFDVIKIVSFKSNLELFDKGKILDSFKPETHETIRYLTINE